MTRGNVTQLTNQIEAALAYHMVAMIHYLVLIKLINININKLVCAHVHYVIEGRG